MGSAKNSNICAAKVFGQVKSAGNLAFNIATLGSGKSATAASDAAKVSELKKKFQQLKEIYKKSEKLRKLVSKGVAVASAGKTTADILAANEDDITP